METLNTITTYISTIGFPIVCVVYMWKYINTTQKELTTAINKLCAKLDDIQPEKEGPADEKISRD